VPLRILTTHLEFEGQINEQRFVMDGEEPPAWGPEAELRVVGKPTPRVDGRERVSGAAKYTYDIQLPGMLYAAALRSPHPHARVLAVETSLAEALPGVRAVFTRFNAADLMDPNRGTPVLREELLFQGQEVAVVVAETYEAAEEAVALLEARYEPLPFVTDPEHAEQPGAPRVNGEAESNLLDGYPKTYTRGNVEQALAEAEALVELRFETPSALHNSMETHGAVCDWDGRTLTAYSSTQDVFGARQMIAKSLGLQQNQVNVVCHYMGGGFGSKFGAHTSGLLAAYAACKLGRPVHFLLSREAENLAAGNRPPTVQTYKIAAKKDGTLTALDLRAMNNVGALGNWASPIGLPAKELYQCPNVRSIDVPVRTNLGTQASFRAPGVVEGTVGLEVALDELARAIGMDPLEFRRKNFAENNQLLDGRPYAAKSLLQAYSVGAERVGWATRDDERRRYPKGRNGSLRRGVGMASQIWGGDGGPPAQALAKFTQDGTAVIVTGTQDIGTGTRTVLAQIAAEELGVPLAQVRVELGETEYGFFSPASGGSMTLASMGPAVRMAAAELRKDLLEVVSQLAEAPTDVLDVREGKVYTRDTGRELGSIGTFTGQLDGHEINAKGMRGPNAEDVTVRTFGAHFAEVEVDIGTGAVRVTRIVAIHDCGRIVNPLTWTSQIEGGIIQGLGFALMEQRLVDERLGTVVNPNLESYEVPTIRDVPEIEIIGIGQPLAVANTLGSLGAGEPPIIPAPAAIANAVAHALGRPVRRLPLTRDYILELMAEPGGGAGGA
jgi:xanthine dehydrogenase YagR molybdenum-binding subunit